MTGILNGSIQIRIEPFGQLVDELFGTTQPRRLSDPGFIMCTSRVPKYNVVSDLLRTKARVSASPRGTTHQAETAHRQREVCIVLEQDRHALT